MLIALAGLIGRIALRAGISEMVANFAGDLVSQEAVKEASQEIESDEGGRMVGVESETFYAFHLADRDSWTRANQGLADLLKVAIPQQFFRQAGPEKEAPFTVSTSMERDGVRLHFTKTPTTTGFERREAKDAARKAVRKLAKGYIRAAAAGASRFNI